ncbi:kinase-like domain-containing protein [Aspergillus caelatus]|uniref:Kinase-like domain-containing protein n=1 Tax=Aspergillus caelatus TaxID=61420 RepID=A0A5N6ZVM5_9EURO|nr:kinase-like domain-containing protein [Aspergillus caelatus]KAE8361333.1 kinase-like domain-containing protein [Aspergillus caelatus]
MTNGILPKNSGMSSPQNEWPEFLEPGKWLSGRYKVIRKLGCGSFGKVVEAYDDKNKHGCAIKISKEKAAARQEFRTLEILGNKDPKNETRSVRLLYPNLLHTDDHVCLVMELFGETLLDVLDCNGWAPIPPSHVQHVASQVFASLTSLGVLGLFHNKSSGCIGTKRSSCSL